MMTITLALKELRQEMEREELTAADTLRDKFSDIVERNLVKIDPLWRSECCAFNIQIGLSPEVKTALGSLQDELQNVEAELLRCPTETLHISVLPLLAVRVEYSRNKTDLWRDLGGAWLRAIASVVSDEAPITIHFKRVVATDSAVVVVATPTESINSLRCRLATLLQLPEGLPPMPTLVHASVFRYGSPLRDPARFLSVVDSLRPDVTVEVAELTVLRELVYPSLRVEEIETFKFEREA